ncbi:MAG TPA: 3-keto-5-aminohexanoate cleavage protein [Solirubrobacteraceae bacterium]|nr:3-keto-5-aminohexanoate cleavage protein [Solirubrobacteraceae bacterium]
MSFRAGAVAARAFARTAAVTAEAPAVLACAVSGGIVTGNPNQPVSRDDVIAAAIDAARAGASVVHVHARSADGQISQAPEDYLAIKQAIREQAGDVLLSFTTGGQLGAPAEDSRRSLQAEPDLATVTCGSMNFGPGGDLLISSPAHMAELLEQMAAGAVLPEYECFDLGMALTAAKLASSAGGPPGIMHMLLGIVGGAPATPATISLFADLVPSGVPWMVTAIARHFPLMAVTLALGGHVRTGLEDVVYVAPGEYADSNAQLVARAVAMCEAIGRPVATVSQARDILGVAARQEA